MEGDKAKQSRQIIRDLKKNCEHRIETGVYTSCIHCAIAMALLGVQNAMTECDPTPNISGHCETSVRNPAITSNSQYKHLKTNAGLIM